MDSLTKIKNKFFRMFDLMELRVLCNGVSISLIISRGFGKELYDRIEHCLDKYSYNIDKMWQKFPDNIYSFIVWIPPPPFIKGGWGVREF